MYLALRVLRGCFCFCCCFVSFLFKFLFLVFIYLSPACPFLAKMFFAGYFFYCPFPYVCFTTFFSPSRPCSRFGLIWSRLSYDHGWIRSRPVSQVMRDKYKQYSFPPKTSRSAPITLTHKGSALLDDRVALRPHRMWGLLADSACHGKHNQSSANQTAAASQTIG